MISNRAVSICSFDSWQGISAVPIDSPVQKQEQPTVIDSHTYENIGSNYSQFFKLLDSYHALVQRLATSGENNNDITQVSIDSTYKALQMLVKQSPALQPHLPEQ